MNLFPFNIVLTEPPGYAHGGALHELARLLALSLGSLGHPVVVNRNTVLHGAANVLLGYQLGEPPPPPPRGVYWIPYQLEQLSEHDVRLESRWIDGLARAPEIWDYDPANIAYLRSRGILNVKHVPIGFHPAMQTIPSLPASATDIDILHYGSVVGRRQSVLDALAPRCKLKSLFGVYGAERDGHIARAKIVLNVHLYHATVFEQVRVSYLLNNRRCVVSEDAPYNPYPGMTVTVAYDQIVERCMALLADDAGRERFAAQAAARFEAMPMTEILSRAIGADDRDLMPHDR